MHLETWNTGSVMVDWFEKLAGNSTYAAPKELVHLQYLWCGRFGVKEMRGFLTNRREQLLESLKRSKSLCGFGAWRELDICLLLLLGILASNPFIFFYAAELSDAPAYVRIGCKLIRRL
ncbi:hypothetical protein HU200_051577 [Digitaria exilis]|uniref:Uncharacterized protein n=1 Tax=Digitaria exilis TaxID=1010633 RepID=A0A835AVG3_9POAL|nr:hypothetical protein HU200_051577 [Digitaria exilis]